MQGHATPSDHEVINNQSQHQSHLKSDTITPSLTGETAQSNSTTTEYDHDPIKQLPPNHRPPEFPPTVNYYTPENNCDQTEPPTNDMSNDHHGEEQINNLNQNVQHQSTEGEEDEPDSTESAINERMLQILSDLNDELAQSQLTTDGSPLIGSPLGLQNAADEMSCPLAEELNRLPFAPHVDIDDDELSIIARNRNVATPNDDEDSSSSAAAAILSNEKNSRSRPRLNEDHPLMFNGGSDNRHQTQSTPLLHASLAGGLTSLPQSQLYSALPPQPQLTARSISHLSCELCGQNLLNCLCNGGGNGIITNTSEWRQASRMLRSACSSSTYDNHETGRPRTTSTGGSIHSYLPARGSRTSTNESRVPSPLIGASSTTMMYSRFFSEQIAHTPAIERRPVSPLFAAKFDPTKGPADPITEAELLESGAINGGLPAISPPHGFLDNRLGRNTPFNSDRLSPSTESHSDINPRRLTPTSPSAGYLVTSSPNQFLSSVSTSPAMKYKKAPAKGWWKTEICKFWRDGGGCRNEGNCRWAHGTHELRRWASIDQDDERLSSLDLGDPANSSAAAAAHATTSPVVLRPATQEPNRLQTPFIHLPNSAYHPIIRTDVELPPHGVDSFIRPPAYFAANKPIQPQSANPFHPQIQNPAHLRGIDHQILTCVSDNPRDRQMLILLENNSAANVHSSSSVPQTHDHPNLPEVIRCPTTINNRNWILFSLTSYGKQKRAAFMNELWTAVKNQEVSSETKQVLNSLQLKGLTWLMEGKEGIHITPLFWRNVAFIFRNITSDHQQQHKRKCGLCGSQPDVSRNKHHAAASKIIEPIVLGWALSPSNGVHNLQLDCCNRCQDISQEKSARLLSQSGGDWSDKGCAGVAVEQTILNWIIKLTSILRAIGKGAWRLESDHVDILTGEGLDNSGTAQNSFVRFQQKIARAVVVVDHIVKKHVELSCGRELLTSQVVPGLPLLEWMVICNQPILFVALLCSLFPLRESEALTRLKHRFPNNGELADPSSSIALEPAHKILSPTEPRFDEQSGVKSHDDDDDNSQVGCPVESNASAGTVSLNSKVNGSGSTPNEAKIKDSHTISAEISTAGNSPTSSQETLSTHDQLPLAMSAENKGRADHGIGKTTSSNGTRRQSRHHHGHRK